MPPRSDNLALGGVYSFVIDPPPELAAKEESFVRLLLAPSAIRLDRVLRLPICDSGFRFEA
jgi:hypothetical protein